jgi:hypothetical protein
LDFSTRLRKFSYNVRLDIQTAMENGRARLGKFGDVFALSAILVFLSFVILTIFAPIAIKVGGIFSYILGIFPFGVLIYGIYIAIKGLLNLLREQNINTPVTEIGVIAKSAIDIAFGEIINAGLVAPDTQYNECLSGRLKDYAFVALKTPKMGFCVIRLKEDFNSILLANPVNSLWPVKLPTEKKLAPLSPPQNLELEVWSFDNLLARDKAQILLDKLEKMLLMSKMGGELPYICAHEKSLVLGWERADLGSIALLGNEAARGLLGEAGA